MLCHDFGIAFYIYVKLTPHFLFTKGQYLTFKIDKALPVSCFIFWIDTVTFSLLVYWIVLQYVIWLIAAS